jgi:hypothetical protein
MTTRPTNYLFEATVWLYPGGQSAWHFITVPKEISAKIKKKFGGNARGWGSLPVAARIQKTEWKTSIFPDTKSGTYLLPLKASVRRSTGLFERDKTKVRLSITV